MQTGMWLVFWIQDSDGQYELLSEYGESELMDGMAKEHENNQEDPEMDEENDPDDPEMDNKHADWTDVSSEPPTMQG